MLSLENLQHYCQKKKALRAEYPFGADTLVLKVAGKIFLLCDSPDCKSLNVKGDPLENILHREKYPDLILPGYHMNKIHWNTIINDGTLPDGFIYSLIDASYVAVVEKLSAKLKKEMGFCV